MDDNVLKTIGFTLSSIAVLAFAWLYIDAFYSDSPPIEKYQTFAGSLSALIGSVVSGAYGISRSKGESISKTLVAIGNDQTKKWVTISYVIIYILISIICIYKNITNEEVYSMISNQANISIAILFGIISLSLAVEKKISKDV
ncbi:MAG: hypothetical protein JJ895_08610 [Balneolaceae bacterium]|nr:hypothetical protein [Balneolaceae bacterium]